MWWRASVAFFLSREGVAVLLTMLSRIGTALRDESKNVRGGVLGVCVFLIVANLLA